MTRDELVENNLPLVKFVIRQRYGSYKRFREDIYEEGVIGLVQAANMYNESLGYKFSTYAYQSIDNQIKKYLIDINRLKRKANINTYSVDEITRADYNESKTDLFCKLAKKEQFVYEVDFDNELTIMNFLERVDKLKIKNGRFICERLLEGYNTCEIADMIGVSHQAVSEKIKNIRGRIKSI